MKTYLFSFPKVSWQTFRAVAFLKKFNFEEMSLEAANYRHVTNTSLKKA